MQGSRLQSTHSLVIDMFCRGINMLQVHGHSNQTCCTWVTKDWFKKSFPSPIPQISVNRIWPRDDSIYILCFCCLKGEEEGKNSEAPKESNILNYKKFVLSSSKHVINHPTKSLIFELKVGGCSTLVLGWLGKVYCAMSPVAFERTREYVWLCTFKMWFNRWVFLGFWRHAHLSSFGEFQALLCRYKPDLVFSFKMRKSSTSWFFLISLGFSSIWLNNFNDFWNYTATGWAFFGCVEGGEGHNYPSFRKYLVFHEGKCQHLVHLMISFYMPTTHNDWILNSYHTLNTYLMPDTVLLALHVWFYILSKQI